MTAAAAAANAATHRRSPAALVLERLRYEQRSFWRNRAGAFFVFLFPLMFLLIFGTINSGQKIDFLGGLDFNQFYVCGIMAFGIMSACYSGLAIQTVNRRESGVLKRLRGMPVPSYVIIGGAIASMFVVALILVALTAALGIVLFGFALHGHYLALVVVLLVGVACFSSLGLALQTLIRNADAAPAIVNGLFFPIQFLSGIFFPLRSDSVLSRIADFLPVRPLVQAIFTVFDPRTVGAGFNGSALLRLGIWTAIGVTVAVRRFRWEPRGS